MSKVVQRKQTHSSLSFLRIPFFRGGLFLGTIFFSFIFLFFTPSISAQTASPVIPVINYTGRLKDTTGKPIPSSAINIVFSIYDGNNPATANKLWTETHNGIAVKNGYFNLKLGSQTFFPEQIDFSEQYYLGIQITPDPEMTPLVPFTPAPYAFYAFASDYAHQASTASHLSNNLDPNQDITIVSNNGRDIIASSSGDIVLNTPAGEVKITSTLAVEELLKIGISAQFRYNTISQKIEYSEDSGLTWSELGTSSDLDNDVLEEIITITNDELYRHVASGSAHGQFLIWDEPYQQWFPTSSILLTNSELVVSGNFRITGTLTGASASFSNLRIPGLSSASLLKTDSDGKIVAQQLSALMKSNNPALILTDDGQGGVVLDFNPNLTPAIATLSARITQNEIDNATNSAQILKNAQALELTDHDIATISAALVQGGYDMTPFIKNDATLAAQIANLITQLDQAQNNISLNTYDIATLSAGLQNGEGGAPGTPTNIATIAAQVALNLDAINQLEQAVETNTLTLVDHALSLSNHSYDIATISAALVQGGYDMTLFIKNDATLAAQIALNLDDINQLTQTTDALETTVLTNTQTINQNSYDVATIAAYLKNIASQSATTCRAQFSYTVTDPETDGVQTITVVNDDTQNRLPNEILKKAHGQEYRDIAIHNYNLSESYIITNDPHFHRFSTIDLQPINSRSVNLTNSFPLDSGYLYTFNPGQNTLLRSVSNPSNNNLQLLVQNKDNHHLYAFTPATQNWQNLGQKTINAQLFTDYGHLVDQVTIAGWANLNLQNYNLLLFGSQPNASYILSINALLNNQMLADETDYNLANIGEITNLKMTGSAPTGTELKFAISPDSNQTWYTTLDQGLTWQQIGFTPDELANNGITLSDFNKINNRLTNIPGLSSTQKVRFAYLIQQSDQTVGPPTLNSLTISYLREQGQTSWQKAVNAQDYFLDYLSANKLQISFLNPGEYKVTVTNAPCDSSFSGFSFELEDLSFRLDQLTDAVQSWDQNQLVANTNEELLLNLLASEVASESGLLTATATDQQILSLNQVSELSENGTLHFTVPIVFEQAVTFQETVAFNQNAGGTIIVPAGTNSAQYQFTTPYQETPVVNLTPNHQLGQEFWLHEVTPQGFSVQIKEPASKSASFNWTAIMVK